MFTHRLRETHRDRSRDRPDDAGATFRTNHSEKVPTPAMLASDFLGASNDEGNCNYPFTGEGQDTPPLRASQGSDEQY